MVLTFRPSDGRVPAESTPRAVARKLLSQLFQKRIGNVRLYEVLSDAHERCSKTTNDNEYDNILWQATERALDATLQGAKPLAIVVDGVDEASCGEAALLQRLTRAASMGHNVKLVTLGTQKPSTGEALRNLPITEDLVFDDVAAVVRRMLLGDGCFKHLPEMDQETMINRLTQVAGGSFLNAKLLAKRVRGESDPNSLSKAIDAAVNAKWTIADFVMHNVHAAGVSDDARMMLLWLAIADRPLLVGELEALASIQVDKQAVTDRLVEPSRALKPVISLVFREDGAFCLRHALIREAILGLSSKGKLIPAAKDWQADLTARLLIYIKSTVMQQPQQEPALVPLNRRDLSYLLSKNHLLDFAVRYWPTHFGRTVVRVKDGENQAAKEFAKVLPTALNVFLLGAALWENRPTPELLSYHAMVTNICRQLLPEDNPSTLQCIVFLAIRFRRLGMVTEATPLFHEATMISQKLLGPRHVVTMEMAKGYIELTTEKVTNTKTDIMVKREVVLVVLIESYKKLYGLASKQVLEAMQLLEYHYRVLQDTQKSEKIKQDIDSTTQADQGDMDASGQFQVRLQAADKKDLTQAGDEFVLDVEEKDQQINRSESFNFDALMLEAEQHVAKGRKDLAELAYVELWQHVSQQASMYASATWEERKLTAVHAYSRFLKAEKREHEASSILFSAWQEHERSSKSMTETSAKHFQQIANMMKTVGLSSAALHIFKQCHQYYKCTSRTHSQSFNEVEESIKTTSRELIKSVGSSQAISSESMIEQTILEASASIDAFDQATFEATINLIDTYISQHRWKNASRLIKRVLHGIWPSFFSTSIGDATLAPKQPENCIVLAEKLAECYHFRQRTTREEDIRVRIYRALRSGRKVDNQLRVRHTDILCRFFKRTSQIDQIIVLRQEMLSDYTEFYGAGSPIVIDTLRTLASLTRPRPIFLVYYQQIIQTLNKDPSICHPDAFEPLDIVATELWSQGRYTDALPYLKTIFTTFLGQPKQTQIPKLQDQSFMRDSFTRYTYCLRTVRTDFKTIHKVTSEYQTVCTRVFGESASATIQATLSLAKLCQESKNLEPQAIALYKKLLDMKAQEIDLAEVSATLRVFEEEQAVAATHSESASTEYIERALVITEERMRKVRQSHSYAHEESLTKLEEMVSLYNKRKDTKSVVRELTQTTQEILKSESSSTRLTAAAATIASCYMASNQRSKVVELSDEVYRQTIMKDTGNSKAFQFDLASRERQSLSFLAQLEHSLSQSSASISEIFASLSTEFVYFEEFRHLMKSKQCTLDKVTASAARLHGFLISRNRRVAAARVVDEFIKHFTATEGKRVKMAETQVKAFVGAILDYFGTHESRDFVRSIGIMANEHVGRLLKETKYMAACDLAIASFQYLAAQDSYRNPDILKFAFTLGLAISGHVNPRPDEATRQKMVDASAAIMSSVLQVVKELQINLAQVNFSYLNRLIGILGEKEKYPDLAWLLSIIWNNRRSQASWQPDMTFALVRRFILARYLAGELAPATRLAEDIVYNCRRVHGAQHPSSLEMSVLLSQVYTAVAQKYQARKDGQDMANRFYKKSAALNEVILRVFTDPTYAEMEGGLEASMSADGSAVDLDLSMSAQALTNGQYVRRHFHLFKLAVQRLGKWPKDYNEYVQLNKDVFGLYAEEMNGVDGIEKWNMKAFGAGKAEGSEDILDVNTSDWELVQTESSTMEDGLEEEL